MIVISLLNVLSNISVWLDTSYLLIVNIVEIVMLTRQRRTHLAPHVVVIVGTPSDICIV